MRISALVALLALAAVPGTAAALPPQTPACTITGGPANDELNGTPGADVICGLGGDDTIDGLAGNDTLIGGDGNDTLDGGAGANLLLGGRGNDHLAAGTGDDAFYGGAGADRLSYAGRAGAVTVALAHPSPSPAYDGQDADGQRYTVGNGATAGGESDRVADDVENLQGGSAADALTGSAAANTIEGLAGADVIAGGAGADRLLGGVDGDLVHGGSGDDTIVEDKTRGRDVMDGDAGVDTVDYSVRTTPVRVTLSSGTLDDGAFDPADDQRRFSELDTVRTTENAIGGAGDDVLTGPRTGTVHNVLRGGGGNDDLDGFGGSDTLDGGSGDDTLGGAAGLVPVPAAGDRSDGAADVDDCGDGAEDGVYRGPEDTAVTSCELPGAHWTSPEDISGPGGGAAEHLATAPDGSAISGWLNGGFAARTFSPGTGWGPEESVAPVTTSSIAVALAANGGAVFAWTELTDVGSSSVVQIHARLRSPEGVYGPPTEISGADGTYAAGAIPQVSISPTGDAVLTWLRVVSPHSFYPRARIMFADGTVGPATTLAGPFPAPVAPHAEPQAATDAAGRTTFTWSEYDGTHSLIRTRTRNAAGAYSAATTISPAGTDGYDPQLAADAAGHAVFTWGTLPYTAGPIVTRSRTPAGAFGAVATVTPSGFAYDTAVDGAGGVTFAWLAGGDGPFAVQTRRRPAGGSPAPTQTLGTDVDYQPDLTVNAGDEAVVAWGSRGRAFARRRSMAGLWGARAPLSDRAGSVAAPQVALSDDGHALALWRITTAGVPSIQVAREP